MADYYSLITAVLITYALAITISQLDGPFDVFQHIRQRLGGYDLAPNGQPATSLGRFIICPYCIGTWLAILPTLLLWPIGWGAVGTWLAVVGGHFLLLGLTGH